MLKGIRKLKTDDGKQVIVDYSSLKIGDLHKIGQGILHKGQKVPIGDDAADIINAHLCKTYENRESNIWDGTVNVKGIDYIDFNSNVGWPFIPFNRNFWTPKGLYVVIESEAQISLTPNCWLRSEFDEKGLMKRLDGGKAVRGVKFSRDGLVRYAPKETIWFGIASFKRKEKELAENGFMIASFGKNGAERLSRLPLNVMIKSAYKNINRWDDWEYTYPTHKIETTTSVFALPDHSIDIFPFNCGGGFTLGVLNKK